MHVIKRSEYRVMPWKNGGGMTTELFAFPRGTAGFDWRVSIATVNQDGPFSTFRGYERHIMVLSGNGMRMDVAGWGKHDLHSLEPFTFSGEAEVVGALLQGPVEDFNLIVREDFGGGALRVADFKPGEKIGSEDGPRFYYLLYGVCHFGDHIIHPNDSFWLDQGECTPLAASMKVVVCEITPR